MAKVGGSSVELSFHYHILECATVALGMRLICLCLSVLGVLHVRVCISSLL